ncbi:MAG: hypothetical protein JWN63_2127 [Candidatus Acidoferrum typicum]|nr:hypothetical protein [Candidatus Acidoferrum typicum]
MTVLVRSSVDFVDLHGGVYGEIGIANGGAGRCGQMPCRGGEFTARTLERVGITVALGAGQGKRIGGDEFVERSAMAVRGDVASFRLGNLQEVASNAGQADGLGWSRTTIRGRHALQIEVIYDKEKGGTDQDADKRAHGRIVGLPAVRGKRYARRRALENNVPQFSPESQPLCYTPAYRRISLSGVTLPLRTTNEHNRAAARTACPQKLREEELEEARAIQSVILPAESLRADAVMISHEFQPVAAVGGDFLDYFELTDGSVGLHQGDGCGTLSFLQLSDARACAHKSM